MANRTGHGGGLRRGGPGPGIWIAAVLVCLATALAPVAAQGEGTTWRDDPGDRDARRLFQRFAEDAAVVPGGWMEGQYVYDNLPDGTRHFLGPLAAFKLVDNVEAGLRFGFLDANPDAGSGGSGLSDIDLYAKFRLPMTGRQRVAFGVLVKAPTADDRKALGTGATDVELFGAWRADLVGVSLVANVGARFNGDPPSPLPEARDSVLLGGAIVMPATRRVSLVVEGTYESKRFKGADADGRLTVGLQAYGPGHQGGFRAGVAFPLTDGAPDYQLIGGAFFTY
ncbi:MAG TPA: hypothetical protein VNL37_07730 [Candidatus Polarisedimenticolia bacterium]|nr:hypothetical protein [Candidatus Polarisedimenticolia bacterium]